MLIQDWILLLDCIIALVFLFWSLNRQSASGSNRWRLAFLMPVTACLFHVIFFRTEWCLTGIYLGSILAGLGFFVTKVSIRKKSLVLAGILCITTIVPCYLIDSYRKAHYVAEFEEGFACMKEYYTLSEHKNIHWDELYEEYLPLFQEAEKEQDAVANSIAWMQFCNEFYDAHVGYAPREAEDMQEAITERVVGNDYGLATVQLDSGEFVAVLVEPGSQAELAGIRTGTVIVEWNGKKPDDWLDTCRERMHQSTICGNVDNQEFYVGCYLAGIGEEQVQVAFLDESGNQKTVILDAMDSYAERFEDVAALLTYKEPRANISVTAINDDIIVLNTNMMEFSSETSASSDYGSLQASLREQLIPYRDAGATKLIIDLRNNGGGSTKMAQAIVALVAEGEIFWAADGAYNEATGEHEILNTYSISGENLWEDGEIVVLTNSNCGSAANHCLDALQELDNVTVIGLTQPAGMAQGVTSVRLEYGMLAFSGTCVVDENADIWIDSDESGKARLQVDEQIPFDEKAVEAIFLRGEDYVMNYAIEYMQ
ncbi:MAG: hypothetical protein IJ040_05000 [Lachnospiraceae bacterium]|nr:hypothetical protein [Lachnospiraceae bacterium]